MKFPMSKSGNDAEGRLFLCLLFSIFAGLLFGAPSVPAAGTPLVLAVHPYLPVPEIQKRFGPLTDYLTAELGRPVTLRIGGNYKQHMDAIGHDEVDIAFLGPAEYVKVTDQYSPKPLLVRYETAGQSLLTGVIAVRQDSPLQALGELGAVRFAFVDPDSTMGYVVPCYLLLQAGIPQGVPTQRKYLGSHRNVALAVLAGDYDAGAMKQEVFDECAAKGLRALIITPSVPDHVIVARATLPPADIERIRQALLRLKDQPTGPALLNQLQTGLTSFGQAHDADFAELRTMVRALQSASTLPDS